MVIGTTVSVDSVAYRGSGRKSRHATPAVALLKFASASATPHADKNTIVTRKTESAILFTFCSMMLTHTAVDYLVYTIPHFFDYN